MALYRLSVKLVKEHVSSKVAYIERQGKYSKGAKSEELRESWSEGLPSWAENSSDFWHDIEEEEKPGQVQARGIELALPVELSKDEQKAIVEEFSNTVLKNHARTIAIHDSKDGKNPHVHIYFSERKIDDRKEPERGKYCRQRVGYSKDRSINGAGRKQWLKNVRKAWENIQNDALLTCEYTMNGGEILQVSANSLEAQGIQREAQIHVGYQDINRYRKTGEKGARFRRNEAILERNRAYSAELSAVEADVKRLEKAVKEERKAQEEAAKKAEEARKNEMEARKNEVERLQMEAARKAAKRAAEEARRRADDEAKAKAEAAQKAKEDAKKAEKEAARKAAEQAAATAQREPERQPEPEPITPERWPSDDTMFKIAIDWSQNKWKPGADDLTQIEKSIRDILPDKIDFSKIDWDDKSRLCEAARAIIGDLWRGSKIKKPETGRRVFSQILEAARVLEWKIEREPERTPEASPELDRELERKPEIPKNKKTEKNRGMER